MILMNKKVYVIGSILSAITCIQAALHKYEFNITADIVNPDCHDQGYAVPLVNGQFPGPAIHVNQGDELEIMVRNQMTSMNTSVHYHGIRQIGTVEADGVPGVTQHSIPPGESYLQKFKVENQAGTYFYHAHVGLQDDSLKGAFIVYESDAANPKNPKNVNKETQRTSLTAGPYTYQDDLTLQLGEWWHDGLKNREDYYMGSSFVFDHGADSILMNGRTIFDPEKKGLNEKNCQGYATLEVEPNTTYRLRVIGAGTFRTLAVAIKNHNLTLIEVDGELTQPYNTSFLEVAPGQRYSVLLHTGDHPPGTTFAIGTSYLWRQRGHGITENGFGYLRYAKKKENVTHLFKPIQKWSNHQAQSFVDNGKKKDTPKKSTPVKKPAPAVTKPQAKKATSPVVAKKTAVDVKKVAAPSVSKPPAQTTKAVVSKSTSRANVTSSKDTKAHATESAKGGKGDQHAKNGKEGQAGQAGQGGQGNRGGQGGGQGGQGGGRGGQGGQGGGGRTLKPTRVYTDLPTFPNVDEPDWFYHQIKPLAPRHPILDEKNVRTIKLVAPHLTLADNTSRYLVNNRLWPHRPVPLTKQYSMLKSDKSKPAGDSEYNPVLDTYPVAYNETLDLVFQNIKNEVGGCLLHPWHTHGHSHYVIASGLGDYVHDRDKNVQNFAHPLYRDTTIVYPSVPTNETEGCGWTKIRIVADNPGFWAVHCHITTHMIQGKMIVLEEAPHLIEQHKRYK